MLVHVLAIFSGFLAPLVFYLVKRNSRFVAFHSLQVLIWHATYLVTFVAGLIITFTFMIFAIAAHPRGTPGEGPPLAFFGVLAFIWVWGLGGLALNLILGIVYAIKANHGEWARYPVIGNFVLRKILPEQPIS